MRPKAHEFPFSLWGVLNPLADTQFVRVFPVEATLEPGLPEPLDARFVSTDLQTGAELVWRDSVMVDSLAGGAHVFYAPLQVENDHTYRLEVTGADGRASWVEVDIPGRATLFLEEPDTTSGVLLPASIRGPAERVLRSEVEIYVRYIVGFTPPPLPMPIFEYLRYTYSNTDRLQRIEDGWRFAIELDRRYFEVLETVSQDEAFVATEGITLLQVSVRAVLANEEWSPPDGVFDPNVLGQPGVMENVQNGFGFVGGGFVLERPWTLLFEVVEKTGFRPNR